MQSPPRAGAAFDQTPVSVEDHMAEQSGPPSEPAPLLQRFYDSPFLLLLAGLVVPTLIYTVWGLWEIFTLPPALLP